MSIAQGTRAQRRREDGPAWHGQIHAGTTKAAPATPAANRECESLATGKSAGIGSAAARCELALTRKDANAGALQAARRAVGVWGAGTEQEAQ